ncbi:MAG: S46 family peptidase [Bacteroidota bacterium]
MNRYLLSIILISLISSVSQADEGLWIPMLLKGKTEQDMQKLGMRLSAEDIYSINKNSLKDAIVQFGGGCTAEIVSAKGLILTNHHCGFSNIQSHSSLEHDYLSQGFWAMRPEEELPNKGLTVELLIRMEDVTEKVMNGINAKLTEKRRDSLLQLNITKITKEAKQGNSYEARVRPFYGGNAYYLFVVEIFKDIRLVGAPPSSVGKFGGDTDNWVWPRHTGDFSVFRIYVGKDGKPSDYSKDNVPYEPKYHLPVSLKGYKPNDFTMIYGYPGRTQEYLPSMGVSLITEMENPIKIKLRDKRLEVIKAHMSLDRGVRIEYSAKAATIANAWKKWQGESHGIKRLNTISKKKELELDFQTWAFTTPKRKAKYGKLLDAFESTYKEMIPLNNALIYYQEAGMGIEMVRFAQRFNPLVELCRQKNADKAEIEKTVKGLRDGLAGFYKDYQVGIDQEIAPFLLGEYAGNVGGTLCPDAFDRFYKNGRFTRDPADYSREIFDKTMFSQEKKMQDFLDHYRQSDYKKLIKDPGYSLSASIAEAGKKVQPGLVVFRARLDSMQRIYMQGLMEMLPGKNFYPDANSTLRLAYGKVDSYKPADGIGFNYFTTLDGVIQKEDSTIYDYKVEPKIKALYAKKDYGPYADKDGSLHTCFIANMHTSGGNSGSPVLNASGQLIGLNFDRCWEGTMSDLAYDPDQCRNITLDIRYCLWVIDKYAGAGHLVKEMTLIQ